MEDVAENMSRDRLQHTVEDGWKSFRPAYEVSIQSRA